MKGTKEIPTILNSMIQLKLLPKNDLRVNKAAFNSLFILMPSEAKCSYQQTSVEASVIVADLLEMSPHSISFYYCRSIKLQFLLSDEFLSHCRTGLVYCHSNQDAEVTVSLEPDACLLTLHLSKHLYQCAGLSGTKRGNGFDVSVDVGTSSFKKGSKLYDRWFWSLTNVLAQSVPLSIVSLDGETGEWRDMTFASDAVVEKLTCVVTTATTDDVVIPSTESLPLSNDDGLFTGKADEKLQMTLEFIEWVGMAHIKSDRIIDAIPKEDSFVCVYDCLLSSSVGQINCIDVKARNGNAYIVSFFLNQLLMKLKVTQKWVAIGLKSLDNTFQLFIQDERQVWLSCSSE